jgi:hypothetical protein
MIQIQTLHGLPETIIGQIPDPDGSVGQYQYGFDLRDAPALTGLLKYTTCGRFKIRYQI